MQLPDNFTQTTAIHLKDKEEKCNSFFLVGGGAGAKSEAEAELGQANLPLHPWELFCF